MYFIIFKFRAKGISVCYAAIPSYILTHGEEMDGYHCPSFPPCRRMKLDLCLLEMITLKSIALLGGNAAKMPISSQDDQCFLTPEDSMEVHVLLSSRNFMCQCG